MRNQQNITLGALLDLQLRPIARWFRIRLLLAERSKEQINARYFCQMVTEGNRGLADSQKRLMNIRSQLMDLGE